MVKNMPANVGDAGWISGSGRSSGEGNGNPLQYSCLEKLHGQRSLAGCSPWGRTESDTAERLSSSTQSELFFIFLKNKICTSPMLPPGGRRGLFRPSAKHKLSHLVVMQFYEESIVGFLTFQMRFRNVQCLGNMG